MNAHEIEKAYLFLFRFNRKCSSQPTRPRRSIHQWANTKLIQPLGSHSHAAHCSSETQNSAQYMLIYLESPIRFWWGHLLNCHHNHYNNHALQRWYPASFFPSFKWFSLFDPDPRLHGFLHHRNGSPFPPQRRLLLAFLLLAWSHFHPHHAPGPNVD